jgi:hypothetical protein
LPKRAHRIRDADEFTAPTFIFHCKFVGLFAEQSYPRRVEGFGCARSARSRAACGWTHVSAIGQDARAQVVSLARSPR